MHASNSLTLHDRQKFLLLLNARNCLLLRTRDFVLARTQIAQRSGVWPRTIKTAEGGCVGGGRYDKLTILGSILKLGAVKGGY